MKTFKEHFIGEESLPRQSSNTTIAFAANPFNVTSLYLSQWTTVLVLLKVSSVIVMKSQFELLFRVTHVLMVADACLHYTNTDFVIYIWIVEVRYPIPDTWYSFHRWLFVCQEHACMCAIAYVWVSPKSLAHLAFNVRCVFVRIQEKLVRILITIFYVTGVNLNKFNVYSDNFILKFYFQANKRAEEMGGCVKFLFFETFLVIGRVKNVKVKEKNESKWIWLENLTSCYFD